MRMRIREELLLLGLLSLLGRTLGQCKQGHISEGRDCVDDDECQQDANICGKNTQCFNTDGSFYCKCLPGFRNVNGTVQFTALSGQCQDINECVENNRPCGPRASCSNHHGHFNCTCLSGFRSGSREPGDCRDINECEDPQVCGGRGSCENEEPGFQCTCPPGFTTYGNKKTPCSELSCDHFAAQSPGGLDQILTLMRSSCLDLANSSSAAKGEDLLKELLTVTDTILSPTPQESPTQGVGPLLTTLENAIIFIGPQLKKNRTTIQTNQTDAVIDVHRGNSPPIGPLYLTNENAALDMDWETAAGSGPGPYPGFTVAALLSYRNLTDSVNRSFSEVRTPEGDGEDPSFQISSRVVSVVVSNPSTDHLSRPVNITLRHLQDAAQTAELRYVCAFWTHRETWSTEGCSQVFSNSSHTLCSCQHLSSFAVLMALYPIEHPFALQLVGQIGLVVSIVCLVLSILTFRFCRSIQGTRTTIHLHLSVCLLVADLVFLVGISRTQPVGGCRLVAALLHYFFLGVFCWMLLEGVQLYRMVVLVFNAAIRPLYLFLGGYGTPLLILIISASARPHRYGTALHCWLSLEDGLIWSFFGPVSVIIVTNVFFFIVTVWKLAQKFSSINPELSTLRKIRAFTVTAVAQMCVLGLMWIFGALLFEDSATSRAAAYVFTALNSLQGALLFLLHCLLSKQVREEYSHFLSRVCKPQKKRYSDLNSSSVNPSSSSQSQASKSRPLTGESHI